MTQWFYLALVGCFEFKNVYYQRNSTGINRRGYSGCIGWGKIIEKVKKLKTLLGAGYVA